MRKLTQRRACRRIVIDLALELTRLCPLWVIRVSSTCSRPRCDVRFALRRAVAFLPPGYQPGARAPLRSDLGGVARVDFPRSRMPEQAPIKKGDRRSPPHGASADFLPARPPARRVDRRQHVAFALSRDRDESTQHLLILA